MSLWRPVHLPAVAALPRWGAQLWLATRRRRRAAAAAWVPAPPPHSVSVSACWAQRPSLAPTTPKLFDRPRPRPCRPHLGPGAPQANDPELWQDRVKARKLLRKFNDELPYDAMRGRKALLGELLGGFDQEEPPFIEPPFYCDYGEAAAVGRSTAWAAAEAKHWVGVDQLRGRRRGARVHGGRAYV